MREHIVVIAPEFRMAEEFARRALNLPGDKVIAISGPNREDMLRALDPQKTTCYYLWIRPTPLMTHEFHNLELAKTMGFRPICVVDW